MNVRKFLQDKKIIVFSANTGKMKQQCIPRFEQQAWSFFGYVSADEGVDRIVRNKRGTCGGQMIAQTIIWG